MNSGNKPCNRLYVGYLPPNITQKELEDLFGKYGTITEVRQNRNFAFIHYSDEASAVNALTELSGQNHFGRKIDIQYARPPRNSGGGPDKKEGDQQKDRSPIGGRGGGRGGRGGGPFNSRSPFGGGPGGGNSGPFNEQSPFRGADDSGGDRFGPGGRRGQGDDRNPPDLRSLSLPEPWVNQGPPGGGAGGPNSGSGPGGNSSGGPPVGGGGGGPGPDPWDSGNRPGGGGGGIGNDFRSGGGPPDFRGGTDVRGGPDFREGFRDKGGNFGDRGRDGGPFGDRGRDGGPFGDRGRDGGPFGGGPRGDGPFGNRDGPPFGGRDSGPPFGGGGGGGGGGGNRGRGDGPPFGRDGPPFGGGRDGPPFGGGRDGPPPFGRDGPPFGGGRDGPPFGGGRDGPPFGGGQDGPPFGGGRDGPRGGGGGSMDFRDSPAFRGGGRGDFPPQSSGGWPSGSSDAPPNAEPAPLNVPNSERTNDIEIIVMNKSITDYGEYIESRLKSIGFTVDIMFPNETAPIARVLGNIASRGTLYAVMVNPQHKINRSLTLLILHGTPQEHRNMLFEDAIVFLNRNYENYSRSCQEKRGPNAPPEQIRHLLELILSSSRQLTVPQFDILIQFFIQEKLKVEPPAAQENTLPVSQQAELQTRILSILNKNTATGGGSNSNATPAAAAAAPPSSAPKETDSAATPSPLLKDPSVQRALDSLMQGGSLFRNINNSNSSRY